MIRHLQHLIPSVRRQFSEAVAYSRAIDSIAKENVGNVQLPRLRKVWADCTSDVPYYEELVEEGLAPRDIVSWSDFKRIPVLTRDILQDRADQFIRYSGLPDAHLSTSGSTGQPTTVGVWHSESNPIRIAKLVAWHEMGYTPGNKIFLLWGHAHLLGSGWRRYWNHFKRSLKDAILGYQRASAYTLDKETCEDIAERLIQFKPFGVIGYAAALDAFLRLTPEYHAAFRNLGVQFVMPAAEAPPHEDTISMIEDVFGCTTIQEYAGVEFGQVAMKIGSDPFHVFPDLNVLETGADRSASGSAAFVTTLYDRYVPLIRYNTGDAIHGGEQTAQGHIHRFREIAGRSNDSFQMQDGKVIHSEALSHCIRQETDVHGIQIVKKGERIEVRLVAHTEHTKPIEQRVRRRLNQVHEQLGTATIVWAEDMTVNRAGKRRWLVEKAR